MILLDTNIIIYSKQAASPFYPQVIGKLEQLVAKESTLVICPQVLYEFYRFATSPEADNRGFGLSPETALKEIEGIKEAYTMIGEGKTYEYWEKLMGDYEVSGKKSHDARLVATMQANGVTKLLTLNTKDFQRFTDIIELV